MNGSGKKQLFELVRHEYSFSFNEWDERVWHQLHGLIYKFLSIFYVFAIKCNVFSFSRYRRTSRVPRFASCRRFACCRNAPYMCTTLNWMYYLLYARGNMGEWASRHSSTCLQLILWAQHWSCDWGNVQHHIKYKAQCANTEKPKTIACTMHQRVRYNTCFMLHLSWNGWIPNSVIVT